MPREYTIGKVPFSGARLHMLHHLTRTNFDGDLLSGPILEAIGDSPQIADVACGTGVWSLELAEKLPDAKVEGLDITLNHVPADNMLPANVSFKKFDILGEIPQEYLGRFDVVSIRYVVLFVRDQDFNLVLNNLLSMIKPGGWLQWTDVDASLWKLKCGDPHAATPGLQSLLEFFRNTQFDKDDVEWSRSISRRFQTRGLEAVEHKHGPPKPSNWRACLMNWLWGLDETFQCESANLSDEAKASWKQQYEAGLEEAEAFKAGFDFGMFRCIGRKALK